MIYCENCGIDNVKRDVRFDRFFNKKYLCKKCHPMWPDERKRPFAHEHMKVDHAGNTKLTYRKDDIFINSIISPDDNKTVIDKRTGKEAEY